jgi:aminoglycoside/choline kinase family phosphotransferase
MAIRPLPTSAAQVGTEWLTEVLHESGALPLGGTVTGIERQPIGEGVGMMSDLARLVPTYGGDATGAPASLVGKFPAHNATNREVAVKYDIYRREVRYYAELDPLCSAHGPAIHLSVIDPDNTFVILMEDLSDYMIGDQILGASLEQTEICVDELAKLHASFWNKVSGHDWLPHIAGSQHAANMRLGAELGWDAMLETFGEFVPNAINALRGPIQKAIGPLQARLDTSPITLIHGDFRMDNLFFGKTSDQHALVMLDWQGPLCGRGIQDVAQLLGQSTQTEVRRAHQSNLIRRYVDALEANGISGYGFDEAWEDYRHATLYSWAYVVVVSGTLDASNERGFAWMSKMVARNATAIEDLNCLELL